VSTFLLKPTYSDGADAYIKCQLEIGRYSVSSRCYAPQNVPRFSPTCVTLCMIAEFSVRAATSALSDTRDVMKGHIDNFDRTEHQRRSWVIEATT
jgi:hypothetical protein